MAKDSLSANPVAAQRKAEKARALKKGKAQVQAQRNDRLAKRNPDRLERQIEDLKEQDKNGGLRPNERQQLDQLEKDLRAVKKARDALGDKAPSFARGGGDGGFRRDRDDRRDSRGATGANGIVLGKRRRFGQHDESESSETDEDARDIPMPRDTPPPIPRRRRGPPNAESRTQDEQEEREPHALPARPEVLVPAKTVYSSAPVVRDLRKEAVSKFIPSSVKVKPKAKEAVKEEAKKDAEKAVDAAVHEAEYRMMAAEQSIPVEGADLDEAEKRFERELRQVEMEEVEDEDA